MGGSSQEFAMETIADDEEEAEEWAFSTLGSKHRVRRPEVTIDDVDEISLDEVEDPTVRYKLEQEN
jgi:large subunit ribosomal protein LX